MFRGKMSIGYEVTTQFNRAGEHPSYPIVGVLLALRYAFSTIDTPCRCSSLKTTYIPQSAKPATRTWEDGSSLLALHGSA